MAAPDDAPRQDRLAGRFVGVGAVVGAILWPLALGDVATKLTSVAGGSATSDGLSPIVPLAIALLLFSAAIAMLELRAPPQIRFVDLVGDLTIGTATVLLVLAAAVDSYGLLGPGFALLFGGSVIFGAAGLNGKRRPRWGSALVLSGAGGLLACFLVAATLGIDRLDDVAQTALVAIVLYGLGWAWLGLHLALARRLVAVG